MSKNKKAALTRFHKEKIAEAAEKLFIEKGISNTTMDEIARAAEYSKSTLYVYFKNKEDLVSEIILNQMKYLRDRLGRAIEENTKVIQCYYAICKELIRFEEENPFGYQQILREIRVTKEDMEKRTIRYDIYIVGEQVNDIVENLLKKGIECGIFREDLNIIPTVFYLWSELSQAVIFAEQKKEYIKMRMGMEKEEYMQYCFGLLLRSIQK